MAFSCFILKNSVNLGKKNKGVFRKALRVGIIKNKIIDLWQIAKLKTLKGLVQY